MLVEADDGPAFLRLRPCPDDDGRGDVLFSDPKSSKIDESSRVDASKIPKKYESIFEKL